MDNLAAQVNLIEKEIRETPYHKGTEHHIGKLRARLARLKDKQIEGLIKTRGGRGGGYAIKKQGDATIVLIGPPSAGKSTLLNKLTNAESKVAPYAFTTVSVIPGMFIYKSAYIQILDVPGLIEEAQKGKGRGKEVLSVARGSDLLIIMSDVKRLNFIGSLVQELENSGIRINQSKPDIRLEKKIDGGLSVQSNLKQDLSDQIVKEIASEFGFKNGLITLKQKVTIDDLIDTFSKNRVYIPALFVINKVDTEPNFKNSQNYLTISAEENTNLDSLKEIIWHKLNFLKIYLVEDDKRIDQEKPIIMKQGQTIKDLAEKLGTNFLDRYHMAKIWGETARYPGQEVPLTTKLTDNLKVRFI